MTVRVDHGPPLVRAVAGVGRPSAPPARHPDGRPRAGDYILAGARIQAEVASKPGDLLNSADTRLAKNWLESALAPLLGEIAEVGVGGELVPVGDTGDAPMLRNTVADPNYVTAAARARIELAHTADVLELALDAAETVAPKNSLEKMLSHQLAAAHHGSMKLTEQLNRCVERMGNTYDADAQERANVQGTRLAGAIARLNGSFRQGLLTLHKMRSSGNAVVAGEIAHGPGGRPRRKGGSA